jgi:ubiquinone biosynthesis protein UbiJ
LISIFFSKILEKGSHFILTLDSTKQYFLERFNGRVVKLEIKEVDIPFYLVINKEKIYVYTHFSDNPDTIIRCSLFSLMTQVLSPKEINALEIEGNVELAHQLKILIQEINIDWEQYLSLIMGDVITQQLGVFWRKIRSVTQHTAQRTSEDLIGYIQEEKRLLPTSEEVEDFYEEILALRNDIERLEARMDRIKENDK